MSFRVQLINMGTRAAACEYFFFTRASQIFFKNGVEKKNLLRDEKTGKVFLCWKFLRPHFVLFCFSMRIVISITVQAKLRCLHDYHQRLLHNTLPLPSGVDIANTIKYFSQTLLSKYL